jgi:hypothetical protein
MTACPAMEAGLGVKPEAVNLLLETIREGGLDERL